MKIKRYMDKNTRSAMAQVRADLGPDAVILSNKTINGQVELVAAIDLHEESIDEKLENQGFDTQEFLADSPAQMAFDEPQGPSDHNPTLAELQAEMHRLRSMLETELSQLSWRDVAEQPSLRSVLNKRLVQLGLSKSLCGEIVDQLPLQGDLRKLWIKALKILSGKIPVMGDSLLDSGGIVAMVGSTGVGKTTTIAKLAARFAVRHGHKEVALITTDRFRIGGQEQLETFARYIGIPMKAATDSDELKAALDAFSDRKLVLIDTAGMSQRDVRLHEQFTALNSVGYDIASYVVLSSTTQSSSLQEVVNVFGGKALAGAIITKVDEAASLGGALDVIVKNRLPVGYVSVGQKVPEDIMPARSENLVAKAVELADMSVKQQSAMSGAELVRA